MFIAITPENINNMFMSRPIDRMYEEMSAQGIQEADLARDIGETQQTVNNWKRRGSLPDKKAPKVADVLGVSVDWLLRGRLPKYAQQPSTHVADMEAVQTVFIKEIPIVGTTQAGPDAHWIELGYPPGYGDEFVDMPSNDPNAYALRVRGGSMGDRIREGEAVVCSPNSEPMVGEEVVVKTTDGQVLVKKLAYRRSGEVALDSIGNGFGRIVIHEHNIVLMHPVIGIVPSSRIKHRY